MVVCGSPLDIISRISVLNVDKARVDNRDLLRERVSNNIGQSSVLEGPTDIAAVNRIQDQYKVVPLSLWGKSGVALPENRNVWAPFDSKADPLSDWKTINRAMAENPPAEKDKQLLEMFATVGIGPGLTNY